MAAAPKLACFLLFVVLLSAGCTRTEHRLNADREAYCTIAERNNDSRWSAENLSIDMDPRSRYFDPYNPDCSPMPADDPASHRYMQCVDGKKGWKHWNDNGVRANLENPEWLRRLGEYAEVGDDGSVRLDVDSALRLAYVNSPLHQRTLETLYLTALDVTGERFRLDTQFFGGNGLVYRHNGRVNPAGIDFVGGRYLVTKPFVGPERNRLNVTSDLTATKNLATAGEVLVGFANSFVFEFTGGDVSLASSLANFSFIQPLLRGAGRSIALEQLTLEERRLLANLRAYGQFRQGFFTQIVIGELGVTGPQRRFGSTVLQSFSGIGGVGGYLGLLQQAQQIRNTEGNLRLQLRTRDRLEALYDNELIDIVQVDQFRQNIESTRASLLDQQNLLQLAVDNYKTETLGLPPDLPIDVDEGLVEGFQLIPIEANPILESLLELQNRIGDAGELTDLTAQVGLLQTQLPVLPQQNVDDAETTLLRLQALIETVGRRLKDLPAGIVSMRDKDQGFYEKISDVDKRALQLIVSRAEESEEQLQQQFDEATIRLEELLQSLTEDVLDETVANNSDLFSEMLSLCRGVVLVQWVARDISSEPDRVLERVEQFVDPVRELFASSRMDLDQMEKIAPEREQSMREDEKMLFRRDRDRLHQRIDELENGAIGFEAAVKRIGEIRAGYSTRTRVQTIRGLTAWIQSYLQLVERLLLVPAQARLEVITVERVELEPERAFQIALTNRLDFMNGRAALVDRWRAIQVAANDLKSNLTITGAGDVRTAKNNPVDFRAATSSLRLGLEFDAPLARLLERNGYRETLIDYQRNRRNLIQSRDSLHKGLRALLRTLEQRRLQLEIQRRAVSIALRRVDQTQLSLLTPPRQGEPGVRPQINPTTAINLLGAQSSLQTSQNSFLAAWLRYYAARIRLYRELGVMQLDSSGKWIENSVEFVEPEQPEELEPLQPLPPPVPLEVLEQDGAEKAGKSSEVSLAVLSNGEKPRPVAAKTSESSGKDVTQSERLAESRIRRKRLMIELLQAELADMEQKTGE